MESELYMYVGTTKKTHFFLHNIHKSDFKKEISHQIYNICFNKNLLKSMEENVFVIEVENGRAHGLLIQNSAKTPQLYFEDTNLDELLHDVFHVQKDCSFAVEYDYTQGGYFAHIIDGDLFDQPSPPFKLDHIDYVSCVKTFQWNRTQIQVWE